MAVRLDRAFLIDVGLGALPEVEQPAMLQYIYDTLASRVGLLLTERCSDEELDELEALINAGHAAATNAWLTANAPGQRRIVAEQLEALKVEIREQAPALLAVSGIDKAAPVGILE